MQDSFDFHEEFNSSHLAVIKNGDTLEEISRLPDKTFQLIISSPPYNIGKKYEQQTDLESYLSLQEKIIHQLVRLTKDNGSIVWQIGNYIENTEVYPLDIYFYPIFKKMGMQLRNRIIWHFDHGLHAKNRFSGRYEVLLWFTKTTNYIFNLDPVRVPSKYPGKLHYKGSKIGQPSGNPLGKNPSDYWKLISQEWESGLIEIPNVKANHPEKTEHPCQFPIELVERCVLALTNENDWVLDPFGGVGSSLLAALKNNRKGMSIDRDTLYTQIAQERVKALQNNTLKFRPLGKPVHQPTGKEKVARIPDAWVDKKQDKLL